ncbi:alcohol dehydrogenase catalytic domain-containing protein [Micromonospora sp. CPCC 206060]|uniref:alcohol dehydrogenase catalytic domain-containing protein n=1 Tax=Micromonospora sp. CPCC 206060 TaxID=3122406 RepID=UPI003FA603E7
MSRRRASAGRQRHGRRPGACGGIPDHPGHEVAGVIAEVGPQVLGWQPGERVAVGWFGGSCGHCTACRTGDVVHCPQRRVPGLSYPVDGPPRSGFWRRRWPGFPRS